MTYWQPNVNIFRDPRWGRGHETYGEDPYLTSKLGVAFVKRLQGDGKYLKIAACAKHFAAHSGPEGLRHEVNAVVSKKDLYETYLPAFEACVKEADVEAVNDEGERILDSKEFKLFVSISQPDKRSIELTKTYPLQANIELI